MSRIDTKKLIAMSWSIYIYDDICRSKLINMKKYVTVGWTAAMNKSVAISFDIKKYVSVYTYKDLSLFLHLKYGRKMRKRPWGGGDVGQKKTIK